MKSKLRKLLAEIRKLEDNSFAMTCDAGTYINANDVVRLIKKHWPTEAVAKEEK